VGVLTVTAYLTVAFFVLDATGQVSGLVKAASPQKTLANNAENQGFRVALNLDWFGLLTSIERVT